ncbi:hypothetical protein PR048_003818 [Dryococelus australis]|uniref:Uncharacterized protein n=1 Tax=Dryococelus australis TaxID=614101 RepID=A0ABQ9IP38_9NEOP|nr:hypothetical protein PR048_003818 [Dryococelus australis]
MVAYCLARWWMEMTSCNMMTSSKMVTVHLAPHSDSVPDNLEVRGQASRSVVVGPRSLQQRVEQRDAARGIKVLAVVIGQSSAVGGVILPVLAGLVWRYSLQRQPGEIQARQWRLSAEEHAQSGISKEGKKLIASQGEPLKPSREGNHARRHASRQRGIGQPWPAIGAMTTSLKPKSRNAWFGERRGSGNSREENPEYLEEEGATRLQLLRRLTDGAQHARSAVQAGSANTTSTRHELNQYFSGTPLYDGNRHLQKLGTGIDCSRPITVVDTGIENIQPSLQHMSDTRPSQYFRCTILLHNKLTTPTYYSQIEDSVTMGKLSDLVLQPGSSPRERTPQLLIVLTRVWGHLIAFDETFGATLKAGAMVYERLDCSPPTKANQVQSSTGPLPDFCMWESCRTMPLGGGLSRGYPVSPSPLNPTLFTSITLIGSRDLAVKANSCRNLGFIDFSPKLLFQNRGEDSRLHGDLDLAVEIPAVPTQHLRNRQDGPAVLAYCLVGEVVGDGPRHATSEDGALSGQRLPLTLLFIGWYSKSRRVGVVVSGLSCRGFFFRTVPLVGGFSRGHPVAYPPLHSGAAPSSPRFTFTDSRDLDVKRLSKAANMTQDLRKEDVGQKIAVYREVLVLTANELPSGNATYLFLRDSIWESECRPMSCATAITAHHKLSSATHTLSDDVGLSVVSKSDVNQVGTRRNCSRRITGPGQIA